VLALVRDDAGARRELRQAQAAGLPPDIALVVDQFASALRALKPWGASFSIGLAPDSNINRATKSDTLDTIIAPLDLSEDAQAKSGVGLRMAGQAFARLPLGEQLTVLPRFSSQAELYRDDQFNDISASLQLGLELRLPKGRLQPALGATWRHYGDSLYARTQTVSVNWLHGLGRRAQLDSDLSVSRADYVRNPLQDGWLYDLSTSYERALDARSGGSLTLNLNRQSARDPGYSTKAGDFGLLYWRELGAMTVYTTAGLRRLEADKRLFLFPERRREWLLRAGLGATFRQAAIAGFAPVVRANWELNRSSVGLYDYRRTAFEFGVTRAF
jgi:outer membrane protein